MRNLKRYRTLLVLAAVLLCICIPVVASAATVTFLDGVNDYAFTPTSTEVAIGTNIGQLPVSVPSRDTYTYNGWEPSLNSTTVQGDITFVAKWTKTGPGGESGLPVYMVVYRDGENQTVFADDEHDVFYNSSYGAATPEFRYPDKLRDRDGYEFKGWKYELNGKVQSECLTELPETVTGYTVYTAQWEEVPSQEPSNEPEPSHGITYYPDYDESPVVTPVPTPTPEPAVDEENVSPKTGAAEVSLPALAIVALAAAALMVRAIRKRSA